MLVTNYSNEIIDDLFSIHDRSFPFPDFDDSTFIEKKVIVNEGKIIGCGLAKLTTEFILILDKTTSRRVRVSAVDMLQKKIICDLLRRGIKDIHVFVNDDSVVKFAEHLGFNKCPEKEVLSLRFGY